MEIIKADTLDRQEILNIHNQAFGEQKGGVIADLVNSLLEDPSAAPRYSFAAIEEDRAVGHILFTRATIQDVNKQVPAHILAPLAVLPNYQSTGVGSALIQKSLDELRKENVSIVFVLGHPEYYPRFGFAPAGMRGFEAPYPIPEEHAAAWMVQELEPGAILSLNGKVQCSDALQQPEHWRE